MTAEFVAIVLSVGLTRLVEAEPFEDAMDAYGRGDYAIAIPLLRPMADHGDAIAQYVLAVMYKNGQGVPQDDAEAVRWFRKAAEQKYSEAQFSLGSQYFRGVGVTKDDIEAARWYRRAADQGNAAAQAFLGGMYDKGQGVPKDYVQADMWLNLASTGGNNEAAQTRDSVEHLMTAAQIAEARKLAREWKPKSN
jgi:uncharacterized protein